MSLFDGIQLRACEPPAAHLNAVVSWFGLETEAPLRVRFDALAGGFVWVLVLQGDLVATLLLHAFGQTADGDLAAQAEPVWKKGERGEETRANKTKSAFMFCYKI